MSIDICTVCDKTIDTDMYPEVYREEFDWACICESCIEREPEPDAWENKHE